MFRSLKKKVFLVVALFALLGISVPVLEGNGYFDGVLYGKGAVTIFMKNNHFIEDSPEIRVKRGDKVVIVARNRDEGRKHNLIFDGMKLETRVLKPGEKDLLSFDARESAILPFHCSLHSTKMNGTLQVIVFQ